MASSSCFPVSKISKRRPMAQMDLDCGGGSSTSELLVTHRIETIARRRRLVAPCRLESCGQRERKTTNFINNIVMKRRQLIEALAHKMM